MVTIKIVTYQYSNRDETITTVKFDNPDTEFHVNKILKFTGEIMQTLSAYWNKKEVKESYR